MAWLMKAEPESRVVKGKDVKFSVDDFEEIKVSPWDGVRNPEASRFMRERMKLGDKVLFYHSNTKIPGIAGFAEICKEGYPDCKLHVFYYLTTNSLHRYCMGSKTDKEKPKWYMVDVRFISRAKHMVSLPLLKHLATLSEPPADLPYLTSEHLKAIKNMALLTRGRLSVQPVDNPLVVEAIQLLADKGGWDEDIDGKKKTSGKKRAGEEQGEAPETDKTTEGADGKGSEAELREPSAKKKRKSGGSDTPTRSEGTRRSSRLKK
ncbi:DUF55-domain-containing protein [Dacryopinax primogenitus]|uniref:DUF55-domain-containing protein n=1 Tax=Dacryopinax primogenitus (strain DJM 731) TaxID=1858805 RepID=M5G9X7_DACPD|nr:DUF55-domain-containing protein [Dacryopinax primogenitus]EJU05125.1 DUF55-domain-containing protein [Dacryopinax primogenitus]